MLQPCQDNYSTTFGSLTAMQRYHEKTALESRWHRCRVNELHIEPLDKMSPLYGNLSAFAAGTSAESIEDTAENLGLAMQVDGAYYPIRITAYKSLGVFAEVFHFDDFIHKAFLGAESRS